MGDLLRPFRSGEAIAEGMLTRRELRRHYVAVYPGVYLHAGVSLTARLRAECAWLWSERRGTIAGPSAAAAHHAKWIGGAAPAHLVHRNFRPPELLRTHADELLRGETMFYGDIRTTTVARTGFDLARWCDTDEAVRHIDALLNANPHVDKAEILEIAQRHPRARGLRGVAGVVDLVDGGADSPPETATRLLLVRSGFPRPVTRYQVFEPGYGLVARLDLAYPELRLAIEYDGDHHWLDRRQRAHDIDRYDRLDRLGWRVVRVSAELLGDRPHEVLARIEREFTARGLVVSRRRPVESARSDASRTECVTERRFDG
ncbi:endonuclease domain-containing protein [Tsukamurella strandjordii]|uniref:DUF559 domain-containing protein n=1 Tax=Tsukamurella strandjordii TaxID=147577 RepID=A0AA90SH07_9ACTN|nr:DUF559 domain-containing protein [Tsukamurella strandjordii]MDP0398304.1 DUF559 domain-containing protein [Tsukamurella strandjordii]